MMTNILVSGLQIPVKFRNFNFFGRNFTFFHFSVFFEIFTSLIEALHSSFAAMLLFLCC